jgi:MFS family permease
MINLGIFAHNDLFRRELPFQLKDGRATEFHSAELEEKLAGADILRIDTLMVLTKSVPRVMDLELNLGSILTLRHTDAESALPKTLQENIREHIADKEEVKLYIRAEGETEISETLVQTVSKIDYSVLVSIFFSLVFYFLILFSAYLLIHHSEAKENVLIVFFLLILAIPEQLNFFPQLSYFTIFCSAFLGLLFYHFICLKIKKGNPFPFLYIVSLLLGLAVIILDLLLAWQLQFVLYIWSVILFVLAFIKLTRFYKQNRIPELRRLINAFGGLFYGLIALAVIALLAILLVSINSLLPNTAWLITINVVLALLIVLLLLGFLFGFVWFLGAFTWSLLSGTVLDVKIRSTLIYSIVGVLLITIFGLIDYTLGELIQDYFGQFIGSKFMAGIPAAIGLLVVFNPLRERVERVVDKKLNANELDFLQITESLAEKLSSDEMIEGFEEYLCTTLYLKLDISKIAIIKYDRAADRYRFRDIRGSELPKNAIVSDSKGVLSQNKIYRKYGEKAAAEDDIASFALVIPVVYDAEMKVFLALGKKNDNSAYTKRDEEALMKLTDKVKLALQFIVSYEKVIHAKYEKQLKAKQELIEKYRDQLHAIKNQI